MIKNLVKEPIFENGMTVFNKEVNTETIKEIAREAKVRFFKEVYMRNPLSITCSGGFINEKDITIENIDSLMIEVDSQFKNFLGSKMGGNFDLNNFLACFEERLNCIELYEKYIDGEPVSIYFNSKEAIESKDFACISETAMYVLDCLEKELIVELVSGDGEFAHANKIKDHFLEYLSRREMNFFKEDIDGSCKINFTINKSYYIKLITNYLIDKYKD